MPEAEQRNSSSPAVYPAGWLRRFLRGLAIASVVLAAAAWIYSAWGWFLVVRPVTVDVQEGTLDDLKDAVTRMATPHVFSGYEPWHGFGDPRGETMLRKTRTVLSLGRAYSEKEIRFLARNVAWYVAAFRELKIDGKTAIIESDREVVATLLARWANAERTGVVFAIYLSIVALLLSGLLVAYWKLKLFERLDRTGSSGPQATP